MKLRTVCIALFAVFCCFAMSHTSKAASGYSIVVHVPFSDTVEGYSETTLTYDEAYYYNAIVDGFLFD